MKTSITKMMLLRALAFSGVMASGIHARSPMSNSTETTTARPQELGSTTSAGHFVYTVNLCTIVRETACRTDLSVGGLVPDDYTATVSASSSPTEEVSVTATATATSTSGDPDGASETDKPSDEDPDSGAAAVPLLSARRLYGAVGAAAAAAALV